MAYSPEHHRLDAFAEIIADQISSESHADLLTVADIAELLRVSPQWLAAGRSRGWGPPFIKLSPVMVRYRRADLIKWLEERVSVRSTAEWRQQSGRPAPVYEGRRPG